MNKWKTAFLHGEIKHCQYVNASVIIICLMDPEKNHKEFLLWPGQKHSVCI